MIVTVSSLSVANAIFLGTISVLQLEQISINEILFIKVEIENIKYI